MGSVKKVLLVIYCLFCVPVFAGNCVHKDSTQPLAVPPIPPVPAQVVAVAQVQPNPVQPIQARQVPPAAAAPLRRMLTVIRSKQPASRSIAALQRQSIQSPSQVLPLNVQSIPQVQPAGTPIVLPVLQKTVLENESILQDTRFLWGAALFVLWLHWHSILGMIHPSPVTVEGVSNQQEQEDKPMVRLRCVA